MIKHKTMKNLFNILTKFTAIGFIGLCFYDYIPDKLTIGLLFAWTIFSFWFIKLNDPKENKNG